MNDAHYLNETFHTRYTLCGKRRAPLNWNIIQATTVGMLLKKISFYYTVGYYNYICLSLSDQVNFNVFTLTTKYRLRKLCKIRCTSGSALGPILFIEFVNVVYHLMQSTLCLLSAFIDIKKALPTVIVCLY